MACASNSGHPSTEQAAADLQFHIDQAQAARQSGDLPKAVTLLQDAARASPTSKQPWVKLAQMQFEAGNYSAAIVAAEEALQRDATDATALSVLSVGGLRIAAGGLQQLRKGSAVSGSTRSEAEALARTIRESLGEEVLVPGAPTSKAAGPGSATSAISANRTRASNAGRVIDRTTDRTTYRTTDRSPASTSANTPRPADKAVAPVAGGRNPFNVLQ